MDRAMEGGRTARPNVVVVTGGPCAGKTSAMDFLRTHLAGKGIAPIIVPEAATDLILAGCAPGRNATALDFQTQVIALQLKRERYALEAAGASKSNALIICDRGVFDSRAYLSEEEFAQALANNQLGEADALARYDAVFHLESVAKADEAAYTRVNNEARLEDAAGAVAADERTRLAWVGHPNLRVIENEERFEDKAESLLEAILGQLGTVPFWSKPAERPGP